MLEIYVLQLTRHRFSIQFVLEITLLFLPDNLMIRSGRRLSSDVCEAEKDKQSDASLPLLLTVTPLHTAGLLMDN